MRKLSNYLSILGRSPVYLNNWKEGGKEAMLHDFELKNLERGIKIILASYGTPAYEEYAFVLFTQGGRLYEINASHCSCYGLEGQWTPEETNLETLAHRLLEGKLGQDEYDENPFGIELMELLGVRKLCQPKKK